MTDPVDKIEAEAKEGHLVNDERILILLKIVRLQRRALREAEDMYETNCALLGMGVPKEPSVYTAALTESDKLLEELK